MSKKKNDALQRGEREAQHGFEAVSCPGSEKCNQVLLDLHEDFLEGTLKEIQCKKCSAPARHICSVVDWNNIGKITYWYKCGLCANMFWRKIPAMKKYCPNCKTDHVMFWNMLLGLPGKSGINPPEEKILEVA